MADLDALPARERAQILRKIERLRALENGIRIVVVQVDYDSVGVDAPEDMAKVEKILSHR